MRILRDLSLVTTGILAFSLAISAPIKQSSSGICHAPDSSYYSRTTSFRAFDTLEACLASGGRLSKGYEIPTNKQGSSDYARSEFGHGWADEDKDCQNTRQEILISLSTAPVRFSDDKECRVTFGRWISMYTGEVIFDASRMDIDHIVPLKWAWDHGADKWTSEKRIQFANDPANLVAVEASLNRQKGAKSPVEWLPPINVKQYKMRFERVSNKYGLIPKDDK